LQFDAFEQEHQLGPGQFDAVFAGPDEGPFEGAGFEAFVVEGEPGEVPLQQFDAVAPAVDENEHVAAHDFLTELPADDPGQAVELFAHVGGAGVQIVALAGGETQHDRAAMSWRRVPGGVPGGTSISTPFRPRSRSFGGLAVRGSTGTKPAPVGGCCFSFLRQYIKVGCASPLWWQKVAMVWLLCDCSSTRLAHSALLRRGVFAVMFCSFVRGKGRGGKAGGEYGVGRMLTFLEYFRVARRTAGVAIARLDITVIVLVGHHHPAVAEVVPQGVFVLRLRRVGRVGGVVRENHPAYPAFGIIHAVHIWHRTEPGASVIVEFYLVFITVPCNNGVMLSIINIHLKRCFQFIQKTNKISI
jgi:hypothetical protein